ncbi:hypothetical protein NMG60_11035161 [Bertholletia excelsa]
MEGESKKRKIGEGDPGAKVFQIEHDDDEEKKMDAFYSILRSMREARRRATNVNVEEHKRKKMMNGVEQSNDKLVAVWNPTFQPEDFVENNKVVQGSPVDSPTKEETEEEENNQEGLNLKLSL